MRSVALRIHNTGLLTQNQRLHFESVISGNLDSEMRTTGQLSLLTDATFPWCHQRPDQSLNVPDQLPSRGPDWSYRYEKSAYRLTKR